MFKGDELGGGEIETEMTELDVPMLWKLDVERLSISRLLVEVVDGVLGELDVGIEEMVSLLDDNVGVLWIVNLLDEVLFLETVLEALEEEMGMLGPLDMAIAERLVDGLLVELAENMVALDVTVPKLLGLEIGKLAARLLVRLAEL